MRNLIFITLFVYLFAAHAQEADVKDKEEAASKQETSSQQSDKNESAEELRPEVFNPTEQLSEDQDVSFPTDI